MHIKTALTAVAGLLFFAATPAAAVVKVAKYRGIVQSGYDLTGLFGAANTDLTGARYVATYTYGHNFRGNHDTDGVTYDERYGGMGYGGNGGGSPIIGATLTIRGVTQFVGGGYAGAVHTGTAPRVEHFAYDFSDNGRTLTENYINNFGRPAGAPWSLDQSFGPVMAAGGGGSASWLTFGSSNGAYSVRTQAIFDVDAVYSVGNAVPEPASWALMIVGFGMVGGTLRGRRSTAQGVA